MVDNVIAAISQKDATSVWHKMAPLIQKGIERGNEEYDIDDIWVGIMEGEYIPIVVIDDDKPLELKAVIIINLILYPKKRVLNIGLSGGFDIDSWLSEFMNVVTRLGHCKGVQSIYIQGRDGWSRKMKEFGFNKIYTVCEKVI